jgi:DNA-binding NarL/FixJ family response regulator
MLEAIDSVATPAPRYVALIADQISGSAEQTRAALFGCDAAAVVLTPNGDAIDSVQQRQPDLVIVDLDFGSRRQALALIDAALRFSRASIIVVGGDTGALVSAASSERCQVLHRPVHGGQLRASIRAALAQRAHRAEMISDESARHRLEHALRLIGQAARDALAPAAPPVVRGALDQLRPREREIAELLLRHLRVPAVAATLGISPHTVRNHLKNIYRRLGVGSQQQLLTALSAQDPALETHG